MGRSRCSSRARSAELSILPSSTRTPLMIIRFVGSSMRSHAWSTADRGSRAGVGVFSAGLTAEKAYTRSARAGSHPSAWGPHPPAGRLHRPAGIGADLPLRAVVRQAGIEQEIAGDEAEDLAALGLALAELGEASRLAGIARSGRRRIGHQGGAGEDQAQKD